MTGDARRVVYITHKELVEHENNKGKCTSENV